MQDFKGGSSMSIYIAQISTTQRKKILDLFEDLVSGELAVDLMDESTQKAIAAQKDSIPHCHDLIEAAQRDVEFLPGDDSDSIESRVLLMQIECANRLINELGFEKDPDMDEDTLASYNVLDNTIYLTSTDTYAYHALLHEFVHMLTWETIYSLIISELSDDERENEEFTQTNAHGPFFRLTLVSLYRQLGLIHTGWFNQCAAWMDVISKDFTSSTETDAYEWEYPLYSVIENAIESKCLVLPSRVLREQPGVVSKLKFSKNLRRRNGAPHLDEYLQNTQLSLPKNTTIYICDQEWNLLNVKDGFSFEKMSSLKEGTSTKLNRIIINYDNPFLICTHIDSTLKFFYNDVIFGVHELTVAQVWSLVNI